MKKNSSEIGSVFSISVLIYSLGILHGPSVSWTPIAQDKAERATISKECIHL